MIFSLNVGAQVSLENFSFSQLIRMVKELFDSMGLPGFVNEFMKVIEKDLIQSGICCKHCNSDILHVHKITQRRLRTCLGIVTLDVTRFKCQSCTKTFAPLDQLLNLNPHERKSREFENSFSVLRIVFAHDESIINLGKMVQAQVGDREIGQRSLKQKRVNGSRGQRHHRYEGLRIKIATAS